MPKLSRKSDFIRDFRTIYADNASRLNLFGFFAHLKKIKFPILNMFVPSSFSYHSNIWFPNNRLYYSSLKYDKEICRNRYFNLFDFFARQKFQPKIIRVFRIEFVFMHFLTVSGGLFRSVLEHMAREKKPKKIGEKSYFSQKLLYAFFSRSRR